VTSNTIPGKIFVALPDPEQSVVAGVFNAVAALAPVTAVGAPPPVATPAAPVPAENPAFEKRYGKKR
jgi:hypothetical protein